MADSLTFNVLLNAGFTVNVDYIEIIPEAVTRLDWSNGRAAPIIAFNGTKANSSDAATYANSGDPLVVGDTPKIMPDQTNLLWVISAGDAEAHDLTDTITIETFITPVWSLL